MIYPCNGVNCISPYQDARYGAGNRVMNDSRSPGSKKAGTGLTCTVCGNKIRKPGC